MQRHDEAGAVGAPSLLRTALACTALALAGWSAAAWLTMDFRAWTAEDARRLQVAERPVPVPAIDAIGPGIGTRRLPQLLRGADGKVTIVDFVYTRCLSICASLGTGFQQLQARIRNASTAAAVGPAAGVRLLSISFDPGNDDLATLARYGAGLGADPDFWRFATIPDPGALATLLDRFQVVVIPDGLGGYEHNAALLVIDSEGRLVRIFGPDRLDDALNYAGALASAAAAR